MDKLGAVALRGSTLRVEPQGDGSSLIVIGLPLL